MPVCLVFGASGAIGRFLLPRLRVAGFEVVAVSRAPPVNTDPQLRWISGNLDADTPELSSLLDSGATIVSLGPLDAFARWFARQRGAGALRIIAFGSMSIETKHASDDAGERALAQRLHAAEHALRAAVRVRDGALTLFRPTLIYGAGVDRSLTPIARFAERWRLFPRVIGAHGLRQPVHADDLAAACMAALGGAHTAGHTYALGGGERLRFDEMLARMRASLPVRTAMLPIPLFAVRGLAGIGRALGLPAASAAVVARLDRDLVAEHSAAVADFGWAPRAFHPDATAWHRR